MPGVKLLGIARSGLLPPGVAGDPRKSKPDWDLIPMHLGCGDSLCLHFPGRVSSLSFPLPIPPSPEVPAQNVLGHTAAKSVAVASAHSSPVPTLSSSPATLSLDSWAPPPHPLGSPHLTFLHT